MGFKYVGMWAFHNTIGIQIEGGKSDSNPTHPISKWATWGLMVVLIGTHASKVEHLSCKRIGH